MNKTNQHRYAFCLFFFLVLFLFLSWIGPFQDPISTSANSGVSRAQISVTVGETVTVLSPASSNMSLVSLYGGQYSLQVTKIGRMNSLDFIPENASTYSLLINISTSDPSQENYAIVQEMRGTSLTTSSNFTSSSSMLLNLVVQAVSQPSKQIGSSWDPLFGMTGIRIKGISIPFSAVLLIIFAFGACFVYLGSKFGSALTYIGLTIVAIDGIMVVGFLVVILAICGYVGSFVLVNMFLSRASRKKP